jgi:hypothetical protein
MNPLNPARSALLALDFENYGVHPQGYWATHGEPDWPAIARPAVENTARVRPAGCRFEPAASTSSSTPNAGVLLLARTEKGRRRRGSDATAPA